MKRGAEQLLVEGPRQLDTAGEVRLASLGLTESGLLDYDPSRWFWVPRALRGRQISRDDVFVDFGSGKGRVVYLVARYYDFGRVVGVELAPELSAIAQDNIRRTRAQLACPRIDLITADVRAFPIPNDMTYAYLCNPFEQAIFEPVIDRIVESLDRAPRDLTLIYVFPRFERQLAMEEYLRATGRLALDRSGPAGRNKRFSLNVYSARR
jgi:SAM-dependent methyltransferase